MKTKKILLPFITIGAAFFSAGATQAASLSVIADGLDQPRGFGFGPDGTLYIPEPGTGGNGKCQPSPSTLFQPICAGNTGKVTAIAPDGSTSTLFDNFQSLAEQPSKNQGAGPDDIDFDMFGNAYLLTGFAGYPGNRDKVLAQTALNFEVPDSQKATFPPSPIEDALNTPDLAKLFKVDLETEELTEIFDFGRYEVVNNPDKGDVVTNPYDLEIQDGKAYVVDGGGNVSYEVDLESGSAKATALPRLVVKDPVFPPLGPPEGGAPGGEAPEVNPLGNGQAIDDAIDGEIPSAVPPGAMPPGGMPPEDGSTQDARGPGELLPGLFEPVPGDPNAISIQSVPTGNAIGPDGALYVGEYTGFPYPEGAARIFRIGDDGQPQVFAEGFTQITDIEFDDAGNLLVLQFADIAPWKGDIRDLQSSLIEVAPDGTRTVLVEAGEGLKSADGITIGPDGDIYIANQAIGEGEGQIVRLDGLMRNIGKSDAPDAKSVPEPMSIMALAAFGLISTSVVKRKRA